MSGLAEPPVAPPAAAPLSGNAALPSSATFKPAPPSTDELYSGFKRAKDLEDGRTPAPAPSAVTPAANLVEPPAADKPSDAPASPVKKDAGTNLADSFIPESAKKPDELPVAAAPASTNPEDAVVLDRSYTPKAHESFAQVKAITKDLRTQLQKANEELTAARAETEKVRSGAVVVDSPEIATLRAEYEAMSKRLMVVDLQAHPQFNREFVAPRQAAVADANTILAAAGVSNVDMEGLLSKDPVSFRQAVSAIAEKLPLALDKSDFANAARTAYGLKQRGDQAVGKAGEINRNLQAQQVNGYKTAFEGTFSKTLGSMAGAKELAIPADATPEQRSELEAFNAGFRNVRAEAEKIALGSTTPEDISRSSIEAALYKWQTKNVLPLMAKTIKQREARVAELESQLANIRARNPNAQLRGVDSTPGAVRPEDMNHHDAAEYWANKR